MPPSVKNVLYYALTEKMQKVKVKLRALNYYESLEREHNSTARVFQTKKNIPQKVLKEMETSVFNDYFGYVEFDEDCDLEKIRIIADEFIAFKETFLDSFDSSSVQIRFRKLGRHRAAGLYFPMLRCLCVDISSPSSFVHEFGHCIDHTYLKGCKNLSDMPEFEKAYRQYCYLLEHSIATDPELKARLKGKYDLSYYETPTEVFARCFEMYFVRQKELSVSICSATSEMDFAYPESELLDKYVSIYFDKLLAELNDSKDKAITVA
jgi:hypothetical protein